MSRGVRNRYCQAILPRAGGRLRCSRRVLGRGRLCTQHRKLAEKQAVEACQRAEDV